MGVTLPPHNQPAISGKWASQVSSKIEQHDVDIQRNSDNVDLNLTQLNSSVQLLSTQVRDVIGRATYLYTVLPSNTYSGVFSNGPTSYTGTYGALTAPVNITDPRAISVQVLVDLKLNTQTAFSTQFFIDGIALADGHPSLSPNYSDAGWTSGQVIYNAPLSTPTSTDNIWLTSNAVAVFVLKPGSHTIEAKFFASSTASGGGLSISAANIFLNVSGIYS